MTGKMTGLSVMSSDSWPDRCSMRRGLCLVQLFFERLKGGGAIVKSRLFRMISMCIGELLL